MKNRETIQKGIAFFLLVLFSISMAPKVFFHDALANHKDEVACHHSDNRFCLHQQGFNCHFDDLVVTAPFVSQDDVSYFSPATFYVTENITFYQCSGQQYLQHKEGRGPPNS